MADFTDSLEKIMLGAPRGIVLSPEDRERTAYHESGHALVGMLTPDADPVRKVSIIPRGMALGVTLSTPDADRVSYSREDLEAKIKVALGGRVAEEVVYGKITTGAESDIQQLTQIARQMVGRWGMSEKLGPIAVLPSDGAGPLLPGVSETSPQTQWLVDQEVRRLVDEAHAEVTQLLTDHRDQLDSLAHALLAAETLDAPDAYAAAGATLRAAELVPEAEAQAGARCDPPPAADADRGDPRLGGGPDRRLDRQRSAAVDRTRPGRRPVGSAVGQQRVPAHAGLADPDRRLAGRHLRRASGVLDRTWQRSACSRSPAPSRRRSGSCWPPGRSRAQPGRC